MHCWTSRRSWQKQKKSELSKFSWFNVAPFFRAGPRLGEGNLIWTMGPLHSFQGGPGMTLLWWC
jgi:hypothetical protein